MENRIETVDTEGMSLEFERERFILCEKYYEMENIWKELVEKKAHLYFVVLVAFLGAVTFKIGPLHSAINLAFVIRPRGIWNVILAVELVGLLFSVMWVVVSVYKVLEPGHYPRPYPVLLHDRLFSPFADPKPDSDESSLVRNAASRLAQVIDVCRATNSRKSKWLINASRGFILAIVSAVAALTTSGLLLAAK